LLMERAPIYLNNHVELSTIGTHSIEGAATNHRPRIMGPLGDDG
jgi:hypothetical protein